MECVVHYKNQSAYSELKKLTEINIKRIQEVKVKHQCSVEVTSQC